MTLNFDIFAPRVPALFGVDISGSAVKLVELSAHAKSGFRLERYAIEPLPRDTLVDGKVDKPDLLVEALRKAIKRFGSRSKHVALALPVSFVITKRMIVPGGLRPDELDAQVHEDATQYIPFAIEEVNLDYKVIGQAPNSPEEDEVMFAAARKEMVEDRVAAVEDAGLKARIMDSEQLAVQRALLAALERSGEPMAQRNLMLVDIGANNTAITVFREGQIVFSREQAFGGSLLTQEIMRTYTVHADEAERMKLGREPRPDSYDTDVVQPFMESAAQEISRALQLFTTSTQHTSVEQVFLSGGCAAMPGFADCIHQRIDVPVSVLNPFHGMDIAPSIKAAELANDASALVLACGLGLRRFA